MFAYSDVHPRERNSKRSTYHRLCALPTKRALVTHSPYTHPRYMLLDLPRDIICSMAFRLRAHILRIETVTWTHNTSPTCDLCAKWLLVFISRLAVALFDCRHFSCNPCNPIDRLPFFCWLVALRALPSSRESPWMAEAARCAVHLHMRKTCLPIIIAKNYEP